MMREKHIDERVGVYTVFGVHADGTVDVSDGRNDVFVAVDSKIAERICEAQQRFREELYRLLNGGAPCSTE